MLCTSDDVVHLPRPKKKKKKTSVWYFIVKQWLVPLHICKESQRLSSEGLGWLITAVHHFTHEFKSLKSRSSPETSDTLTEHQAGGRWPGGGLATGDSEHLSNHWNRRTQVNVRGHQDHLQSRTVMVQVSCSWSLPTVSFLPAKVFPGLCRPLLASEASTLGHLGLWFSASSIKVDWLITAN